MFLELLAQAAEEKCGLDPSQPLVAGISGGADSLALMVGLQALGYDLIVAHLDHGLRADSESDADFVAALAAARGLRFVRARLDVGAAARAAGQSLEEAAREVRYRFLFRQAEAHGAQAVAVAHHADDQVETVLMHFLRGAALPGLSGMDFRRVIPAWHPTLPVVRPLLGIWREVIEAFVAEAGLTPRVDASNQDTTYFRNRLRHELLPTLETYNPRVRQVLRRMAEVLGEEDSFLDALAAEAWEACLREQTEARVELNRYNFIALPTALQRRVLRRAIGALHPDLRDVGFEVLELGLAFAAEPPESREIDLAARLSLALVGDVLIVKEWDADLPEWDQPLLPKESAQAVLDIGEPVMLQNGWRIEAALLAEALEDTAARFADMDGSKAYLDADTLSLPLLVRGRKMGERWQPLGMGGQHQTLQDFLVNEKIPAHLRDRWPLVCSGGEVVWAAGLRPAEGCKVTEGTRRVLHLRLIRSGEQAERDAVRGG